MQKYIEHTDESYEHTIALLWKDGEDYTALLTERLWAAQKVIKGLEAALGPFANNLAVTDPRLASTDDHPVIVRLVHLRQAKTALALAKGESRNV